MILFEKTCNISQQEKNQASKINTNHLKSFEKCFASYKILQEIHELPTNVANRDSDKTFGTLLKALYEDLLTIKPFVENSVSGTLFEKVSVTTAIFYKSTVVLPFICTSVYSP